MTVDRLLGLVCVRNEADRYLEECLDWHSQFLDGIFIYDDRSNDDSVEIASWFGKTWVRGPDDTAFLEHEGEFRQNAWEAFELQMLPTPDDWVLAFDADEFLCYPRATDPAVLLRSTATELNYSGLLGCRVKIHEVFDVDDDGVLQIRTDGYWDDIHGVRFFRYRDGGHFANRKMGCGSAPTYVQVCEDANHLEILHFGYARKEDRIDKHNRYYGLPGHNAEHIESIVNPPTLRPWTGQVPL